MRSITFLSVFLFVLVSVSNIFADEESVETRIARAMSAAPLDISAKATIIDVDGKVLRKGTNSWTCIPGVSLIPGDKNPMCNDEVWMKWMKSVKENKPFTTSVIGVSYMLQGDALVNNDNPSATDKNDGGVWVKEGPHIMLLVPYKEMLSGLPTNPFLGGPYVMWGKTPLFHVMIPIKSKE